MTSGVPVLRLPRKPVVDGEYLLRMDLLTVADAEVAQIIDEAMTVFAVAGMHGAFPAAGSVSAPYLAVTALGSGDDPRRINYGLELRGIDLCAFELLRNMSERLVRSSVHVSSIAVMPRGAAEDFMVRAPPDEDTEYDRYPQRKSAVRFPVRREWQGDHRARRCVIELASAVAAEHVARLRAPVQHWFALLARGAFAVPVGLPSETDCIPGDLTLYDEFSCEITVNRFEASEMAWNALVNMLDAQWHAEHQILELMIE